MVSSFKFITITIFVTNKIDIFFKNVYIELNITHNCIIKTTYNIGANKILFYIKTRHN